MEKLISFIIPCYNAESTLERAVRSIVSQFDPKVSEVILVENGSSDSTPILAQSLVDTYEQVVLYQSEKGVSAARNLGLERARARYVAFVDADDYLMPGLSDWFESHLDGLSSDLLIFPYEKNGAIVTIGQTIASDSDALITAMLLHPTLNMTVWSKLIKRAFLETHGIRFDVSLERSEDSIFLLEILTKTKHITMESVTFYHYTTDNVSTVRNHYQSILGAYKVALEKATPYLDTLSNQGLAKAATGFILSNFTIVLVRDVFSPLNPKPLLKKYETMTSLVSDPYFQEVLGRLAIKDCLRLYYLPYLFLKLKLKPLAALIYWTKSKLNQLREH